MSPSYRLVQLKYRFGTFQIYVFKYTKWSFSNMPFSKIPVLQAKTGAFSTMPVFERDLYLRLIWNLTVKSRWKALGGTYTIDPGRLDAEAGATGGLGSEGRGRGVEQSRGTGGSPRLLTGSSGGSSGSSGGGGGGGSRGKGYILISVKHRTGTFPYRRYVCLWGERKIFTFEKDKKLK